MSAPWRPDPQRDDGSDWLGDDWLNVDGSPAARSRSAVWRRLAASPFAWIAMGVAGLMLSTVVADMLIPSTTKLDLDPLAPFRSRPAVASLADPLSSPTGRWQVQQSVSPIDDSREVVAVLPQDGVGGNVRLVVWCSDGFTRAYIKWGAYLGEDKFHGSNSKEVTLRSGSEPATTQTLYLSSDGTGTELPGTNSEFLQDLVQHERFAAEIIPYRSGPLTAAFALRGMRETFEPLAATCGWKPSAAHPSLRSRVRSPQAAELVAAEAN